MKDKVEVKKKAGDLLCDIGKYMITVIPFTYFMAEKPGFLYVILATFFIGLLFIIYGLYFIKRSASISTSGSSQKKKIRILKNSVFVVEEEK